MSLKPDIKSASPEEEYFARKNLELKARLREQLGEAEAEKAQKALQEAHYLHCPRCGNALKEEVFQTVHVDRCTVCLGVWLDPGELEQITRMKGRWLSDFISTFQLGKGDLKP